MRREVYQQHREIERLTAFCEQKGQELHKMKEWIAGLGPVKHKIERRIARTETITVEVNAKINKLMNRATASKVVTSGQTRTILYHLCVASYYTTVPIH